MTLLHAEPLLWMSRLNSKNVLSVNLRQLTLITNRQMRDENSNRKGIKETAFLASSFGIIASLVSNSGIATMVFKKSLAALVLALPLVLGMNLFYRKDVDVLNMIAASPSQVRTNKACDFLEPIKEDLLENLFDNECGDTVSPLSPYYEHLSNDRKGSWCSASLFP